jgi:putative transposase
VQRGINRQQCFFSESDYSTVDACARLMKHLGQRYVQFVNKRLRRSGTLWEGRFKSCVVDSEAYALACYRYIEFNPVRAGMSASPGAYRWSSHRANAQGDPFTLVTPHAAYEALGLDVDRRQAAYRALCATAPSASVVEEIRKATRIGCAAGRQRAPKGRPWDERRKMGSVPI